jgi:hypothetical protein
MRPITSGLRMPDARTSTPASRSTVSASSWVLFV